MFTNWLKIVLVALLFLTTTGGETPSIARREGGLISVFFANPWPESAAPPLARCNILTGIFISKIPFLDTPCEPFSLFPVSLFPYSRGQGDPSHTLRGTPLFFPLFFPFFFLSPLLDHLTRIGPLSGIKGPLLEKDSVLSLGRTGNSLSERILVHHC